MTRSARSAGSPRKAARAESAAAASAARGLRVFHGIVIAAAAATVLLTWDAWQTHVAPPMVPLLPLPAVGTGVPLLAALGLAAVRPAAGLAAYAIVLAYAIATDWTRLQPTLVSFGFLLAAGLPRGAGLTFARAHLLTLWFYGGFHKLLSADFIGDHRNPTMLKGLLSDPPDWMRAVYPESVVAAEIGLVLAAVFARTRKLAAGWALVLHAGILLSVLGQDYNRAVWPWNIVLGLAGIFLVAPWRESIGATLRAESPWVRIAVAVLALAPALWQVGIGDPYLAHHLYARSTPLSYVCRTDDPPPHRAGLGKVYRTDDGRYRCRYVDFLPWIDVPEPGVHGFQRAYFAKTCEKGEILFIRERRRFFLARGEQWQHALCRR